MKNYATLYCLIAALPCSAQMGGQKAASNPMQANAIVTPPMPPALQVPDGNTVYLMGSAVGTQNYVCLPSTTGFSWTFAGPQATLFVDFKWVTGTIRQQITTHFLSPNPAESGTARATWQSSLDTSAVWARAIASSIDPMYVAPGAIPWLLLQATGTRNGPNGGTMLSQTTYIQRLNTSGGTMPTTGCTEAANVGATRFVDYTTDYFFYKKK